MQIKKMLKSISLFSLLVLIPFTAFAAETDGLTGVLVIINNLFSEVVPVLVGLGIVYFTWGVVQYFIADNEEAKTKGKDRIIFGIIGLAVIISVWGLVNLLADTFTDQSERGAADVSNLVTQGQDLAKAGCNMGEKLQGLMNYVTCIIGSSVIPLIFALAMVMFVWGAVKFFFINGGEPEEITKGKQFMLWGLIALAVMISVWGLVGIIGDTFDLDTTFLPEVKSQP
jgi:Type IV secretion system pilin